MGSLPVDLQQLLRLGRGGGDPRGAGLPAGTGAGLLAGGGGGACALLLPGARRGQVSAGSDGDAGQA